MGRALLLLLPPLCGAQIIPELLAAYGEPALKPSVALTDSKPLFLRQTEAAAVPPAAFSVQIGQADPFPAYPDHDLLGLHSQVGSAFHSHDHMLNTEDELEAHGRPRRPLLLRTIALPSVEQLQQTGRATGLTQAPVETVQQLAASPSPEAAQQAVQQPAATPSGAPATTPVAANSSNGDIDIDAAVNASAPDSAMIKNMGAIIKQMRVEGAAKDALISNMSSQIEGLKAALAEKEKELMAMRKKYDPTSLPLPYEQDPRFEAGLCKCEVSSADFEEGGYLSNTHVCKAGSGQNASPQLSVKLSGGAPQFWPLRSQMAIVMTDQSGAVHWAVVGMQAQDYNLPQNISMAGDTLLDSAGKPAGQQVQNGFSSNRYYGPCPPLPHTSKFTFKAFVVHRNVTLFESEANSTVPRFVGLKPSGELVGAAGLTACECSLVGKYEAQHWGVDRKANIAQVSKEMETAVAGAAPMSSSNSNLLIRNLRAYSKAH